MECVRSKGLHLADGRVAHIQLRARSALVKLHGELRCHLKQGLKSMLKCGLR